MSAYKHAITVMERAKNDALIRVSELLARITELEDAIGRARHLLTEMDAGIKAAVLAERAACAKIATDIRQKQSNDYDDVGFEIACDEIEAAIKARPAP